MFIVLLTATLFAQIPRTLSYQGILTDNSGNPKSDGSYNVSFSFYEQSAGGTAIWTETKSLTVTKGLFSTSLGDQTPFGEGLKFNKQYWLGITIGADPEFLPRISLNATGYSFSSINSDTANNIINGKVVKSINGLKDNITLKGSNGTTITSTGDTISVSNTGTGGTGIQGVQNTNNTLDIINPNGPTATVNLKVPLTLSSIINNPNYLISATTTGTGSGILGVGQSGIGVVGIAQGNTGVNYGVAGNTLSPTGYAVSGWNLATTGDAVGIIGKTSSPTGIGVLGQSTGGAGIQGISTSGRGVYGSSSSYQGVYGISQTQSGVVGVSNGFDGIYGVSVTSNYAGVSGHNDNGGFGVWGGASSGIGVYGISTSGIGVRSVSGGAYSFMGQNTNSGNIFGALGYHGSNPTNETEIGVLGYTDNVIGIGIMGWASAENAYAGYFQGDVFISKTLLVENLTVMGTKNFQIDHPLDPENKFLIHSCIESPDRLNIYNGNITTNASGLATVNLPSYFEALNIDYRYQLTVIGQFAQVIVEKEIQNNSFVIRTDKPNVKVSWQVSGIRNDAYAKANPMIVEKEKNEKEKGKYYYPELYGQPKSKGQFNITDVKPEKVN
jgi:hypothetical protein